MSESLYNGPIKKHRQRQDSNLRSRRKQLTGGIRHSSSIEKEFKPRHPAPLFLTDFCHQKGGPFANKQLTTWTLIPDLLLYTSNNLLPKQLGDDFTALPSNRRQE
ncbi:Para-nitrobenzyl esterase [Fusarium oxysporum f. sp. albedinis]|nr:Para-nitrobenzyl esterase [Fusarium oxysporum f. sp. albedinis]